MGYTSSPSKGNGGGGGGYYGGGSGGADTGNFLVTVGGGSGYSPPYGSASDNWNPGLGSPAGDAALPGSPYYPGTAGQGVAGDPNAGVTGGAFVIGAYSGTGSIGGNTTRRFTFSCPY